MVAKEHRMEVSLDPDTKRRYSRLYISGIDLDTVSYCLNMVIKKGWHHQPWERRGKIYQQQTIFTTTLIVAYARPFKNKPTKSLLANVSFNDDEQALHEEIIRLRDKVCAHSDDDVYSIRPWRAKGFSTDIVGAPTVFITSEQACRLKNMIQKLQTYIRTELERIVPA
jgi:hypothetical protein